MKTLFLFTLPVILSLNLDARENPFVPTNSYEEEAARIVELHEEENLRYSEEEYAQIKREEASVIDEINANKNSVDSTINKIMPILDTQKTKEKQFSEKEVKQLINKAQKQTEMKTKKLIEEKLKNAKTVEPKQVVFVKPRPDVEIMDNQLITNEILPFVKLEYNDDKLSIYTDYKVSKKFSLDKGNKLIIDYKAKLDFYTKREDLKSSNFKRIAIGNHKKNGYFRVVIELSKNPSSYKVNYKDNLITILNSNEM